MSGTDLYLYFALVGDVLLIHHGNAVRLTGYDLVISRTEFDGQGPVGIRSQLIATLVIILGASNGDRQSK
jgi:hypothetical protein